MDSGVQLVDAQAFQAYAARAAQHINLKHEMAKQQIPSAMGGVNWFDMIRAFEEGAEFERKGSAAVIHIKGFLAYGYDFWMWLMDGSSYSGVINKIRAAAADSGVTKIVLNVNSPGGGTIGVVEASNAIFEARKAKEVVAVVNPEAASAGYWLASQAERIVAMESGYVGSVGAEIDYRSVANMMTQAGIDMAIIRSGVSPDKNIGHPYEPISEEAKAYFQGLVDYAADGFINHVARGRGVSAATVKTNYGKGRMFFGSQALEAGMIDEIGTLESVLASDQKAAAGKTSGGYRMRAAADRRLLPR